MDVLMRRLDNKPYVWAKAKFSNGSIVVNDKMVFESDIISIRNDVRKKYVMCNMCGEYFKKGSKKIEQHKEPCTDTHLCFGCEYLRQRVQAQKSQKYELLENGNYISKSKTEVLLYCSRSYGSNINSQEARNACKYNRCQHATMQEIKGFFLDHPGAFDNIITIDKILECGYKNSWRNSWDKTTVYQLKAKNTIEAIVNDLNIVECFNVSYQRKNWTLYYSKKYDELYMVHGNTYKKWSSCYIDSDVRTRIKDKIAKLYV